MSRLQLRLTPVDEVSGEPAADLVVDRFPFVVGRHPECDCHLPLPFISRHHCSLFLQGDQVCVQDLNSRNGTFVNERRALLPQVLRGGDHLRLGSIVFRVALEAAEPTARPALAHAHAS